MLVEKHEKHVAKANICPAAISGPASSIEIADNEEESCQIIQRDISTIVAKLLYFFTCFI